MQIIVALCAQRDESSAVVRMAATAAILHDVGKAGTDDFRSHGLKSAAMLREHAKEIQLSFGLSDREYGIVEFVVAIHMSTNFCGLTSIPILGAVLRNVDRKTRSVMELLRLADRRTKDPRFASEPRNEPMCESGIAHVYVVGDEEITRNRLVVRLQKNCVADVSGIGWGDVGMVRDGSVGIICETAKLPANIEIMSSVGAENVSPRPPFLILAPCSKIWCKCVAGMCG
jgi:hypothetical protein